MLATLIGQVLLGIMTGIGARALHPGPDRMGLALTLMLGILGSLLGGAIAYLLHFGTRPDQPAGWIFSMLGAIALVVLGFFSTQPRVTE